MSTQPLVLVADDEPRITKLVSIALSEEGFRVVTASGGEDALAKAEEVRPDIVLLDIVMPDLDGIEVMRQLRERRPVPVILLTAKGSTADKAKGLDLGADDYIAKPFHPDELAARVRAVIRRSSGAQPGAGVIRFDDVEIDLERRMVTRGGELVQLSRTEWLLLQHLAANAGKVVLHTELLTKVWGPEYRDDLQYLRVWVSRVRRKLGAKPGEPGRIRTFQGIGYLLDVEGEATSPASGSLHEDDEELGSASDTAVTDELEEAAAKEETPARVGQAPPHRRSLDAVGSLPTASSRVRGVTVRRAVPRPGSLSVPIRGNLGRLERPPFQPGSIALAWHAERST
jgi:two-component system, OmpR family, KDP operon response regulator KdpE